MCEQPQEYALSGGGTVTVYKPFGDESYVAIVNNAGRYPEIGTIAHNIGREEFVIVLEGTLLVERNNQRMTLHQGETVSIPDDSRYTIEGTGRALVIVRDQIGGRTEIENLSR